MSRFFYTDIGESEFSGYYTTMYQIQDTLKSLHEHRLKDFDNNANQAYIEFFGVMQALFVPQDSICELYNIITGSKLDTKGLPYWNILRDLRNKTVGHPSKKHIPKCKPLIRTFMPRGNLSYKRLKFEQWQSPNLITHPEVDLGRKIDGYALEASGKLEIILDTMKLKWNS
jgi:hypothetical protein